MFDQNVTTFLNGDYFKAMLALSILLVGDGIKITDRTGWIQRIRLIRTFQLNQDLVECSWMFNSDMIDEQLCRIFRSKQELLADSTLGLQTVALLGLENGPNRAASHGQLTHLQRGFADSVLGEYIKAFRNNLKQLLSRFDQMFLVL